MDDLVKRLEHGAAGGMLQRKMAQEAADEIKKLRAALQRIADASPEDSSGNSSASILSSIAADALK